MAAGDFHIRRNSADTSVLPNAGSGNEDAGWDTVVFDEGSIVTYTDPNLRLNIGLYLIMYSESFYTSDVTTNERIEVQGEIHVSGTGVVGGYGSDYIRKTSGHQQCACSGYMILDVTANNTDVFIRFYRTDDSTTGTVNREVGHGGVIVLELDSTDNYGFYSDSTTHTINSTESSLGLDTNDRQDTGFTRSGTGITITTAGRYFATYSMDISQTGAGREEFKAHIEIGTTPIPGTYAYCYMRGIDSNQDGALTWAGIIDVAASDVLTVRTVSPAGSGTATVATGTGVFQLWQIPAGGDEAIMEATTGDYNTAGNFAWDTLPFIDVASFTAVAGNSNIDVDQRDHVLVFATFSQDLPDTVQRGSPYMKFESDGVLQLHASGNTYHRNSGGIGTVALTVASLLPAVATNTSVSVNITPRAASGAMNLDNGQFSILSLEAVFGPYTYPPIVTDFNTTEKFNWGDVNLIITGEDFGATQGAGKVEFWSDEIGTIKTTQTVDSWAAGSIQIDTVQGSLGLNVTLYLVVTTNGGLVSNKLQCLEGLLPYDVAFLGLNPDHYWRFNNTMNDTGITGPTRNMLTEVGTTTYTVNNISDGNSHALIFNEVTERIGPADSPNMNVTIDAQRRTLCCWIQPNVVEHPLACIFKEGAQIQNMAFLLGYGNVVIAQMADTPGNSGNVQAWSDIKLTANRPYHICMRYSYPNNFELFLDGVLQTDTDGNPLGVGTFNSHSGDIALGAPDTTLETGGTDITYQGPSNLYLSDFASWSENSTHADDGAVSNNNIRDTLFRRGAVPDDIIVTSTQSTMQTALDATVDARPDWPLSYRIETVTGGGDLELVFTDKVFDDRITMHLEYRGSSALTVVRQGTTDLDSTKTFASNGGTVTVVTQPDVKVTTKRASDLSTITDAIRILMTAAFGGDLPFEDSVTIARIGTVATVTHTAHGLRTGLKVIIKGITDKTEDNNGTHTITVTGVNTYTYGTTNSGSTAYTGTIKATSVVMDADTAAGSLTIQDHRYTTDQPVTIRARRSSVTPLFRAAVSSAMILSTGLDANVFLVLDE